MNSISMAPDGVLQMVATAADIERVCGGPIGGAAAARLQRQLEQIARVSKELEKVEIVELTYQHINQIDQLKKRVTKIWQGLSVGQLRAMEQFERLRRSMDIMERIRREVRSGHYVVSTVRRGHDSGAGKARKSSTKKSAKSATGGSGGGDGGGDGDGPQRTRSTSKKSRFLKISKTPTTHPPCSSLGAISIPSPPHSPPPSRSQGMAQLTLLYAINCILIVVLLAMGERELASIALGSGSISALLNHLKDKPDKKD